MPDVGNTLYPTPDSAEHRRERRLLDEARAEFEQDLFLTGDAVEVWLDTLDGDRAMPLPTTCGRPPGR